MENKDKEVREEYAKAVTRPIESEYGKQIEALKKRKSKLKEKKHADEIAEIDAEIERLTAEMEEKLEAAMAMISIAVYYEARNARRIESQKKSLAIALQKDIKKSRAEKKRQLEIQYGKTEFSPNSWLDCFMLGDIHIVGLGMDISEMDLWWLVNYKKRHFPGTKITLYKPDLKPAERLLAEAYRVEVIDNGLCGNDFKTYYGWVHDRLKENSST